MIVHLTTGGTFTRYLPPDATGNAARLTLEEGVTVAAVLDELGIDRSGTMLVIVNKTRVSPEAMASTQLADGDQLALMPAIRAG